MTYAGRRKQRLPIPLGEIQDKDALLAAVKGSGANHNSRPKPKPKPKRYTTLNLSLSLVQASHTSAVRRAPRWRCGSRGSRVWADVGRVCR